MPSSSTYAVFLATAIALLAIPGPAVLYVVTRSIEMGRAGGLASGAGITTGTFVDPNARHVWLQVLVLGVSFACLGFLSDSLYAFAAGTVADRLRGSRVIAK